MTAYNRLNGGYCTEDEALLAGILRGEWGFEGFVVSDWFGAGRPPWPRPRAGLDLEMPGPGRVYGPALADAVRAGDVDEALVDAMRAPPARRCSTASARSTTTPARRSAPRTGPSTARWRARRPPTASCCCATTGVLPLDPARLALAGRDRPERRPRADHGRRLGQAARALLRHAARGAARARCRTPTCATSAAATSTAPAPELRAALADRGRGRPIASPSATAGLLLVRRRRSAGDDEPLHGAAAQLTPGRDRARTRSRSRQAGRARLLVGGEVVLDGVRGPAAARAGR